ncbi:MAG: hypothetical protein GY830_07395 [Bacteroidetes bacterium]|nr:hypothetical protein [Bacteroidota bacterium]
MKFKYFFLNIITVFLFFKCSNKFLKNVNYKKKLRPSIINLLDKQILTYDKVKEYNNTKNILCYGYIRDKESNINLNIPKEIQELMFSYFKQTYKYIDKMYFDYFFDFKKFEKTYIPINQFIIKDNKVITIIDENNEVTYDPNIEFKHIYLFEGNIIFS